MVGTELTIGGRELMYFTPDDEITDYRTPEVVGFGELEDMQLRMNPRLRRVLTSLATPPPHLYGVLHWSDGSDLTMLDEKIKAGTADAGDFDGALLAEPRTIVCPTCDAQFRVLTVDAGRALFAPTLENRLSRHQFRNSCTTCGSVLSMPIVEIL
jgi:hypothetical protein